MRKAYSYTRFSSPEQASGDSIRRQMAGTEAWIARNPDVELDTQLVFADYGRSGFRGQQFSDGALGRFVDSVRSGAIKKGSYLLIENLDRFSRENPMTATSRLFDLANMGITIVTTSDGLEYSTDTLSGGDVSRLLMLVLQLSQAHVESAKKAERVGAAWARKKAAAREGKHKVSARCPGWLTLVDDEFVLIDDRVKVVQDIFRWTIEGAGRREIARRLNIADPPVLPFKHAEKRRPGRPPPTGWHASAVAKILQNRAVLGEYQPGKGSHKSGNYRPDGDPIPNYYPRIIDDETFWQAKAASQRRRTGAAGPRGKAGSPHAQGSCQMRRLWRSHACPQQRDQAERRGLPRVLGCTPQCWMRHVTSLAIGQARVRCLALP